MSTPITEAGADPTPSVGADGPAALRPGSSARAGAVSAGPSLVLMALGLTLVGQAASGAREDGAGVVEQVLYVAGLLMIFLPAAAGVLLPRIAGSTRVLLALVTMVLLQVARLVVDPSSFAEVTGLVQLQGLRSIEQTGSLYADNALAPLTAYYPGLQVATDAVRSLTGLGEHLSGVAVLIAARAVLALALLAVVGRLTGSTRVGAAAVVVFALDPELPVVGASYDSPTLALGLAALTVHLLLSRRTGSGWGLAGVLPALLAVTAVVVTHHGTAVVLVVGLLVWAVLEGALHRDRLASAGVIALTGVVGILGLVVALGNSGNPADPLSGGGLTSGSVGLAGTADTLRSTDWEWPLVVVSMVLTLLVLVASLTRAGSLLRLRSSLVAVLLLLAVAFPLVPAGLLAPGLAEVANLVVGPAYVGLGLVVAWWVWSTPHGPVRATVLTVGTGVVFAGSLVLGAGPLAGQLPGPFRVGDGTRSIDPVNTAAADWINDNLPAGSRVYGDRATGLLLGTEGDQVVVRRQDTGVDASRLLLDPEVGEDDIDVVREADIRYLVADRRNAEALPAQGYYVEPGEAGAADRTEPVPAEALTKFATVPGVDVVYDNGVVAVYDLVGLDGE